MSHTYQHGETTFIGNPYLSGDVRIIPKSLRQTEVTIPFQDILSFLGGLLGESIVSAAQEVSEDRMVKTLKEIAKDKVWMDRVLSFNINKVDVSQLIDENNQLLSALEDLAERAERCRSILRQYQQGEGNWGMLDTTSARAAIAKAKGEGGL